MSMHSALIQNFIDFIGTFAMFWTKVMIILFCYELKSLNSQTLYKLLVLNTK